LCRKSNFVKDDKIQGHNSKIIILLNLTINTCIGELVSSEGHAADVIQLSDISFTRRAGKFYEVNVCFRHFKHNILGQPRYISFSHGDCQLSAVDALIQYLQVRKNKEGPLFILNHSQTLTKVEFNTTLKNCLLACGLDSARYKGHRFRIGAATCAAQKGFSDAQIRTLDRWQSNAFQKYIRSNDTSTVNSHSPCLAYFCGYLLGPVIFILSILYKIKSF
jgi:hypothetical protein